MRVLYISSADDKYGAPKSMIDMIKPLKSNNNVSPIVIASGKGRLTEFCDKNKIQSHTVRCSEFMVVGGSNTFRKIVKHSVSPIFVLNYLKIKDASVKAIENQVELNKVDVIHTNVNRVDTGAVLSNKYNIPHIWHLREFCKEDYNCMALRPDYIGYMNSHATAFIAISDSVKKAWIEKGLDQDKIVVINDGITRDGFDTKLEYRSNREEQLKIVFCGLVSETKGQKILIDAINLLPEEEKQKIKVDFYGGGRKAYIDKLVRLVNFYGLSNQIKFNGYSNDLNRKLATYDVGIVASRAEALGRVTVEYMYAGLYVIASDSGANPDILNQGKYGRLFNQGNSHELSEAILYALNHPEECKAISLSAKIMAEKRFDLQNSAAKVHELYKDILRSAGRGN